MLQEVSNQKSGGRLDKNNGNLLDQMGNPHRESAASVRQGTLSQLGRPRLNRSESGSSLRSSILAPSNQIDHVKVDKLLTVFNLMQKSDNMMTIILLTLRELTNLIPSKSVAVFILAKEYARGMQAIAEASNGMLRHQQSTLENGRPVDAVSNQLDDK